MSAETTRRQGRDIYILVNMVELRALNTGTISLHGVLHDVLPPPLCA